MNLNAFCLNNIDKQKTTSIWMKQITMKKKNLSNRAQYTLHILLPMVKLSTTTCRINDWLTGSRRLTTTTTNTQTSTIYLFDDGANKVRRFRRNYQCNHRFHHRRIPHLCTDCYHNAIRSHHTPRWDDLLHLIFFRVLFLQVLCGFREYLCKVTMCDGFWYKRVRRSSILIINTHKLWQLT